jgi:V8-like Glu-specific endopeptidase
MCHEVPMQKLAAIAAALAALALVSPCQADDAVSPGSPGADDPAARSAPDAAQAADETLLDKLKRAQPDLPQLPPLDDSANRKHELELDAEKFGTVTKEIGGDPVTEPVTPEVKERVLKGGEAAPAPGDGAPLPQGAIEPAPLTPERTVFGADDRIWIAYDYNAQYPFRAVGLLYIQFADGVTTACSGTMIDPWYVLTAAHCIVDEANGQIASRVEFYPGYNGGRAPYGSYVATRFHVLSGYLQAPGPDYSWAHTVHDLALIRLNGDAGNTVGWFGFAYNDALPSFRANVVGYPSDKPELTLWRSTCDVNPAQTSDLRLFFHRCDTQTGSSGSSMYQYDARTTQRIIWGVNVAQNNEWNSGVRLTGPYYCWIAQTMGKNC